MLIAAAGIALVVSGYVIVVKAVDYYNMTRSESYKHTIKLTWKQLKDFYSINHERWSYKPVITPGYKGLDTGTKAILYDADGKVVRIHLGPLSWLRFKFHRIFNRFSNNSTGMEVFLDAVQHDIDKIRRTSELEIEEAHVKMQNILEGMTNGNVDNPGSVLSI